MPQISEVVTIAIGATNSNVLSGKVFEQVGGRGAQIRLYAIQIDQGAGDLKLTFLTGSDVLLNEGQLGVLAAGLQVPQNQVASGVALPGDRLVLKVENTDAVNAVVLQYLVDIENL